MYDVSQMVVLDEAKKVVGIIDESDVLFALTSENAVSTDPVENFMTRTPETLTPDADVSELFPIFKNGRVAIVVENELFHGIITQIDLINYLRKQLP